MAQQKTDQESDNRNLPQAEAFLLTEYEALRELRAHELDRGEARVNAFLTIVSVVAGLSALTTQFPLAPVVTQSLLVAVSCGILLLGLPIHYRLVRRAVLVTTYTRGMNRIRRYFTEFAPQIERYLILPISDDTPKYVRKGAGRKGYRILVAAILGIDAAFLVFMVLSYFRVLNIVVNILFGIAIFLSTFLWLNHYSDHRLRQAELKADIQFPSVA
jgi:hypothetical protein